MMKYYTTAVLHWQAAIRLFIDEMLSECHEMMAVLVHCQYLLFLTIYKIADTPDQFRNVDRGCQIVVDALLSVLVFCCEIPAVCQDRERPGFHKSPIPFR